MNQFEQYRELLDKAKQYKQPPREKTFFDTAIRNHYENPTTELLEFFLNPQESHELGDVFSKGLSDVIALKIKLSSEQSLGQIENIERECVTHNGSRIDLVIETDLYLVLIEAKIYHHQNNPFDDYMKYAQKRSNQKTILRFILSISGQSEAQGWLGISYQQLVNAVHPYLAEQMLNNPMNKWNLFAHEFLLHLESFNQLSETDMEKINFVIENMRSIEELVELREQVYLEIINHINNRLKEKLGESYKVGTRRDNWSGTPAFRFIGKNWEYWSDTVLNLHIDKSPMGCKVNMYIQHPTDEIVNKVESFLKNSPFPLAKQWYEQKEKYCVSYEFNNFDLDDITKLILFTQNILNTVETERK